MFIKGNIISADNVNQKKWLFTAYASDSSQVKQPWYMLWHTSGNISKGQGDDDM